MLELVNVSYIIDEDGADREILKNISLKIEDDRLYVITGPNGGGKSTLAKLIAGIYTPSSGKIIYNGQDITGMSITERARLGIGFAFQQPVRFKGLTVKDLLVLAAGKELKEHTCDFLSEVGLCAKDYLNREVNASLSGGELKRIEIAVTIARKTKLTIFDEPEAGIDLWSFTNLIDVFKDLKEKTNGSIVIISHQERIINIADELILIADGELVKQGDKEQVSPLFKGNTFRCLNRQNIKNGSML